jgi:hypothetical protein
LLRTVTQINWQNYQPSSATISFDKVTLVSQYIGGGVPFDPSAADATTTDSSVASKMSLFGMFAIVFVALLL